MLSKTARMKPTGQFEGRYLVAMPDMGSDAFLGTVIYICAHSQDGAMGFVINRRANMTLGELVSATELGEDQITVSSNAAWQIGIRQGGPVDEHRGFVLHSPDYQTDSTVSLTADMSLTSTVQILRAVGRGGGPKHLAIMLGYSGWGAGQLESEMVENSWLVADAPPGLVFEDDIDTKYDRAMRAMGISQEHFISTGGRA